MVHCGPNYRHTLLRCCCDASVACEGLEKDGRWIVPGCENASVQRGRDAFGSTEVVSVERGHRSACRPHAPGPDEFGHQLPTLGCLRGQERKGPQTRPNPTARTTTGTPAAIRTLTCATASDSVRKGIARLSYSFNLLRSLPVDVHSFHFRHKERSATPCRTNRQ